MAEGAKVIIGADDSAVLAAMARTQAAVRDGLGRVQSSFDGLTSVFGRVNTAITATAALIAGGSIASLGRQAISTMSDFEQLEIRLNSVMGGADKAQQAFSWIKQFAQDTPFEVGQVTESFMLLKNMGMDPMDGTLKAIADQAAKTGGGFQTLQRVSLALGQAWTKGKLQGEEAMQLLEAGVPVWDMLAKVTGKNTAEVQKLSAQGQLGRDVLRGLIEEIGRTADGASIAQMQSLNGQWSNFTDNVQGSLDELRKAGGLSPLKQSLQEVNDTLSQLNQDGSIKQWAADISTIFALVADAARAMGGVIGAVFDVITELWSGLTGNVARGAEEQITAFDALGVTVEMVRVAFVGLKTGIRLAMEVIRNIVQDVIAAVLFIFNGFSGQVQIVMESVRGAINVTAAVLSAFANVAAHALVGDFSGAKSAWQQGLAGIEGEVRASAARIVAIGNETRAKQQAALDISGMANSKITDIAQDGNDELYRNGKYAMSSPAAKSGSAGTGGSISKTGAVSLLGGSGAGKEPKSKMSDYQSELASIKQQFQLENDLQQMSVAQEVAFWEKKKQLASGNSKDIAAIELKMQELRISQMQKEKQQKAQLAEIDIQSRQKSAEYALETDRNTAQQSQELGLISKTQLIDQEQGFEDRRYQIQLQAMNQRINLLLADPTQDPIKYQQLLLQKEEIERQHQIKMAQIKQQMKLQDQSPQKALFSDIGSSMTSLWDKGLTAMLNRTLTWKNALKAIWLESARLFAQHMVMQPLQQWMAAKAKELAVSLGFLGAKETAETAAASKTIGTKSTEAFAVVGANAAEAASGAASSVASIPYVGWAMAAGVFAATMAMVLGAGSSIKSASGGYSVPRGVNPITQIHEEEMVLPKTESNFIRDLAANGIGGSSSGEPGSGTVNYHDYSGKLSRDQIRDNARVIAEELSRVTKRGWASS